jgi:hypothetical protein
MDNETGRMGWRGYARWVNGWRERKNGRKGGMNSAGKLR